MNQHAKKERMKVIRERINQYDNQENNEEEDIVLN
jgi:hypothetical protein